MKKNKKILILNSGGTFNKCYNPITGILDVSQNNNIINMLLKKSKIEDTIVNAIFHKDSLDINKNDKKDIVNYISKSNYKKIIIVHGTDTMDKTAKYLDKFIKNKIIILTGSMIPATIDPIEAVANLSLAYGYIQNCNKNNIYISMHGKIKKFNKISKNREIGVFQ